MKTDEELEKMFEKYVEDAYCKRYVEEQEITYRKCSSHCPYLQCDDLEREVCLSDQELSIQSFIAGYRAAEMDLSCKQ